MTGYDAAYYHWHSFYVRDSMVSSRICRIFCWPAFAALNAQPMPDLDPRVDPDADNDEESPRGFNDPTIWEPEDLEEDIE